MFQTKQHVINNARYHNYLTHIGSAGQLRKHTGKSIEDEDKLPIQK